MPQYELAVRAINAERLSLHHVHTFNMDEYADEDGRTAPPSWPGSFARAMWERFFSRIAPELRPPEDQIHFPTGATIGDYSKRIEDRGGADVCYGGIGWSGHIAFWEPQLGLEFAGDLDGYRAAAARVVELHPMTVMQNALHSFGGDWSWVPPKAATIGPRDVLGARPPLLLARRRPRGRRLLAAVHRAPRRARPGQRARARLAAAADALRLHDPRQRGRRRGDPHGVSERPAPRTGPQSPSSSLIARSMNAWSSGLNGARWPHTVGITRSSASGILLASYSLSTGGK